MTEREWREASDMRRSTVLLALIVVVAAVLRFWGLGAGIPYAVGIDEPEIVSRAVQMLRTGDYNPRFYDYPGLYIYVQLLVAVLRFLKGALAGEWTNLAAASAWDFFLWGRAVTAALGTLTVLLVYQIGLRWGTRYALLAAGLLAVHPMHVRESHFVLTDVPLTFFVVLTFLLSLRAHEHPRAAAFAWAGLAAGLAAATKYPGALALLLPLVSLWMTPATRPSRIVAALATVGMAALAFLVAAPYTVIDLPGFLDGFAYLASHYAKDAPAEAPWLTYTKHIRISLQWPGFLLAIAGVVLAVVRAARGPARVRWMLSLVFPLLFFWFISRQAIVYGRYVMPLIPFLCVLAAAAVVSGVSLLRRFDIPRTARTALIAGLTAAAIVPPALAAINFNRTHSRPGTLAAAFTWIEANVPKDAVILIESGAPILPHHRTSQRIVQLRHKTVDQYRAEGVQYLVASSQTYGRYLNESYRYPTEYSDYQHLFTLTQELSRFTPAKLSDGPEIRVLKVPR